jgi:hypothetical protein
MLVDYICHKFSKKLLQKEYQDLQKKVQTMHYQKQKLERDLQAVQRRIVELTETEVILFTGSEQWG